MPISSEDIILFADTIKKISDYDFSEYSKKSLTRRIEKMVIDHHLSFDELLLKIIKSPKFLDQIVKEITVNTTELFRDPKVWHKLENKILPTLNSPDNLKIWHAGCSTGQEVYSMCILLNELGLIDSSDIYASDLNEDIIQKAKDGVFKYSFNKQYFENFDEVLNNNPLKSHRTNIKSSKYFKLIENKDQFKASSKLLKKPEYKMNDLVKCENPFEYEYDMILCRNVIIYFEQSLQERIIHFFHQMLKPGGYLLLGSHETILGELATLFKKDGFFFQKK